MKLTAYKQANCRYTHPRPLGLDQKVKTVVFFLLKMVMLHIKIKGMTRTTTCKQNCVLTHTLDPWGRAKGQNFFFSEKFMLHIKLTAIMVMKIPWSSTPCVGLGSGQAVFFNRVRTHVLHSNTCTTRPCFDFIAWRYITHRRNVMCLYSICTIRLRLRWAWSVFN